MGNAISDFLAVAGHYRNNPGCTGTNPTVHDVWALAKNYMQYSLRKLPHMGQICFIWYKIQFHVTIYREFYEK